jgi:hypothetical protein
MADRAARLLKIATTLERETTEGIDDVDSERAFCYWYVIEDTRKRTTALDELIATGNISLISDVTLREKLQLSASESARAAGDSNILNTILPDKALALQPFIAWHSTDRVTTENQAYPGTNCSVDLNAMVGDRGAISVLFELYRGQNLLSMFRAEEVNALEDLIEALKRVTER